MITPADDSFHEPTSGDRWFTETAWYSFWVPERRLSGTLYAWFRPNLRIAASCVALWDDRGESPWEVLHHDYQWHLPWPDGDLADLELRNGLRHRTLEPLTRYRVAYDDRDGVSLDLRFDALMAPHEIPTGTPGQSHLDQPVRAIGTLDLRGEAIEVDCLSMRDRTWGRRPDRVKGRFRSGYTSASVSADHGFHAITRHEGGMDAVVAGYLVRDGRCADLVAGERRVDRDRGRPVRVAVEATDADGRELHAQGSCVNRFAWFNRPTNIAWMSLARWSIDGQEAWGEDQDIWSLASWREQARAGSAS